MESSSGGLIPALLQQMSMPPQRSDTAAYRASTAEADVTSAPTNMPSIDAASARPLSCARSATATRAPSAANLSHMARPMPLAPPVITATLSTRRRAYGTLSLMALLFFQSEL